MESNSSNPMRFRKLRIAWSVFWGLAFVLLILLWVRSYTIVDVLEQRTTLQIFRLESQTGRLSFWQIRPPAGYSPEIDQLLFNQMAIGRFHSYRPVDSHGPYWHQTSVLAFGRFGGDDDRVVFIPHWFPALSLAAMAALPWLRSPTRYSLRTLLVAMTLIAVVLGLVVWATRQ
jgi:hypothetical protein